MDGAKFIVYGTSRPIALAEAKPVDGKDEDRVAGEQAVGGAKLPKANATVDISLREMATRLSSQAPHSNHPASRARGPGLGVPL